MDKPQLVGGIPTGNPKIQIGSKAVRVGGFVISPQGTIVAQPSTSLGLAPSTTLEAPQLQTGSLATGTPLEDVDKISAPTAISPLAFEAPPLPGPNLGVSAVTTLILPIAVPSAIIPSVEPISLGAIPQIVPEAAPLPEIVEPLPTVEPSEGEESGDGGEAGEDDGGDAGGDAGGESGGDDEGDAEGEGGDDGDDGGDV